MIKKYLLGLLVFSLSLVGFSYGSKVQTVGLTSFPSAYDSNFDITFMKGGSFISNLLGQGKSVVALNSTTFLWWATNGQLYFYSKGDQTVQGFFGEYWACDEFTGSDSVPTNCASSPITGDYQDLFKSFFRNIIQTDFVYYNLISPYYNSWNGGSSRGYQIQLCWSSKILHKSMCFRADSCNSSNLSCGSNRNFGSLVNSQNLENLSFGGIHQSWIGYAPGQAGYGGGGNIEGSSNTSINVSMTGNLLYNNSCTNGYVVSEVSRWYGGINNICYAGTYNTGIINDWVAYVPVETGLSYRDVYKLYNEGSYGYYSNYSDWFNSWADTMKRYKLGRVQFDIFNGQPFYLYAYFNKLYESAGIDGSVSREAYDVVNICNLALYSDYNEPYKGSYFSDVCSSFNSSSDSPVVTTGEIGSIDDEEIIPPGFDVSPGQNTSSGMIVSVDWSGTLSGNTNQNFDGKNFINDFYQKLQSVFQKPINSATGIIPGYILVFLVAIILFRFIQH